MRKKVGVTSVIPIISAFNPYFDQRDLTERIFLFYFVILVFRRKLTLLRDWPWIYYN
jgi:hypothetical protein